MLERAYTIGSKTDNPHIATYAGTVIIEMSSDDLSISNGDYSEYSVRITETCNVDSDMLGSYDEFENVVMVIKVSPHESTMHMFDFIESDMYFFSESGEYHKRNYAYFDSFDALRYEHHKDEVMKDGDFELIGYILEGTEKQINSNPLNNEALNDN